MRAILLLALAATLEIGGDALVRSGLHTGKVGAFVVGALTLFVYGLVVNLPGWDFSKLMGVYISIFFVVSQLVAVAVFHEKIKLPVMVGGSLIVAGGLVMSLWKSQ